MTTYVYERAGKRLERVFPMGTQPRRVKHRGGWYELEIQATGVRVNRYEGVMGGPPPFAKGAAGHTKDGSCIVRNRQDIREIEARNPGVRFNPEYYHDHGHRSS